MGVTASTKRLNNKKRRNNNSNYSTSNEYVSSVNFTAMSTSPSFNQILDDETAKKILIDSWRSIDDKLILCQRIMIKFIFKRPKLMAVFQLNSIGVTHFTTTSDESDPIFFRHAEKLVDVFDRLIDAVSTSDEKFLKDVASTIGVRHREVFGKPETDRPFSEQTLDDFCQSIVETIEEENQRWPPGSTNQIEILRNKIRTYWNCLLKEFCKKMLDAYVENANIGTEIDPEKRAG